MNHACERCRISPAALLMNAKGRVEPPVVFLHVKFRRERKNSQTEPVAIQFSKGSVEKRFQELSALGIQFSPSAVQRIRKEVADTGKALVI